MRNYHAMTQLSLGLIAAILSIDTVAAPGELSQTPLLTSSTVAPNIYFSLDSSGSMWHILPDNPYDPNITYFNCTSSTLDPSDKITIFIEYNNGTPLFTQNNMTYSWGLGNNSNYGFREKCFKQNQIYTDVSLFGEDLAYRFLSNGGLLPLYYLGRTPGNRGPARYSGNYLNWYFGSAPTLFGQGAQRKPNTQSRYQVMQEVTSNLLDNLSMKSVRVGIGDFNGGNGANIRVGIQDINTNLNQAKSAVSSIQPETDTPLAESLHQIARYFIQGYNNLLTLHPSQSNSSKKTAYTIFNQLPKISSGVSLASPIQYFCQKNFVIMLTDGQPTQDDGISSATGLVNYVEDGSSGIQLDDVAAAIYDMDLRPDLVDQNNQSVKNNISTYTIGFGLTGTGDATNAVPLLVNTAAQGGGLFFNATNKLDLKSAFDQITSGIDAYSASAASVAFTSGQTSSGLGIFRTTYVSNQWSGDVERIAINSDGRLGASLWGASALLNVANTNTRFIFTYNDETKRPVPFRQLTLLSTRQQNDLNLGPAGINDNKGQDRINYFRGDRTLEGSVFRKRNQLLSDIVHASPVFVGIPESNWPDAAPFPTGTNQYSTFKANNLNRTPFIYVGTNNGMLHGLDARSGQIAMTYMPNILFSTTLNQGLHYLTWPNYSHRFYIDSEPQVQDAYVKITPNGSAAWRTLLMGGLGAGGRGYFLLNVTDPSQFSDSFLTNLFLWEFTSAHDADLGYTFSQPIIGLMNNGRWAMIFGNGYNNTGTGRAKLFIVFLDGGLDGIWTEGSDYIKLDTQIGSLTNLNGLSSPAVVDLDGNRSVDRIYAGDVQGNLWAFDVSSSSPTAWNVAYGTSSTPAPLFSQNNQPITGRPFVVKNPIVNTSSTNAPNLLVLFGTGQYLTAADPASTTLQSLYGVWDSGKSNLKRSHLLQQSFLINNSATRVMNSQSVRYSSSGNQQQFGWYVDLKGGERMVVTPIVNDNMVFFTTLIPNASAPCAFGGTGWLLACRLENCGQPNEVVFDVNTDQDLNDQDKVNGYVVSGIKFNTAAPLQSAIRGDIIYIPKSNGELSVMKIKSDSELKGRISWEDLRVDK